MTTNKITVLFCISALVFLANCKDTNQEKDINQQFACGLSEADALSWDDIYNLEITNLVSKTIVIKSKLYWDTLFGYFDTKPTIEPAGKIKLLFENSNSYITNPNCHDQRRGDLFLKSNEIVKYVSQEEKKEKYSFNGNDLSNGNQFYLLKGKIEYRNWLNVTQSQLADTNFINQHNDVVYWSQSFEFISEKICKVATPGI